MGRGFSSRIILLSNKINGWLYFIPSSLSYCTCRWQNQDFYLRNISVVDLWWNIPFTVLVFRAVIAPYWNRIFPLELLILVSLFYLHTLHPRGMWFHVTSQCSVPHSRQKYGCKQIFSFAMTASPLPTMKEIINHFPLISRTRALECRNVVFLSRFLEINVCYNSTLLSRNAAEYLKSWAPGFWISSGLSSNPGHGCCVVLLGRRTLYSHSTSLHPRI